MPPPLGAQDGGLAAAITAMVAAFAWSWRVIRSAELSASRRVINLEKRLEDAERKCDAAIGRAEQCEEREARLRLDLIAAGIPVTPPKDTS